MQLDFKNMKVDKLKETVQDIEHDLDLCIGYIQKDKYKSDKAISLTYINRLKDRIMAITSVRYQEHWFIRTWKRESLSKAIQDRRLRNKLGAMYLMAMDIERGI